MTITPNTARSTPHPPLLPVPRDLFQRCHDALPRRPPLSFARPGAERQDSVESGFASIQDGAALVAIHDSARPLVTAEDTRKCMQDALEVRAPG